MIWVFGILVVVIIGLVFLASQGRFGGMPALVDDRPGPDLPEGRITAADLGALRFAVTSRGYSMVQVDAVLDRLTEQLAADNRGGSVNAAATDLAGLQPWDWHDPVTAESSAADVVAGEPVTDIEPKATDTRAPGSPDDPLAAPGVWHPAD